MRGFTQQEQRAILFLLVTFGIGCAILWYRRSLPPPPVARALLDSLQVYAQHTASDSQHVEMRITPNRPSKKVAQRPLDLNAATLEELMALPGVGVVLAQRILEYRTRHGRFSQFEELEKVKGLGKSKMQALKEHVIVR